MAGGGARGHPLRQQQVRVPGCLARVILGHVLGAARRGGHGGGEVPGTATLGEEVRREGSVQDMCAIRRH